jgi:hypothetical protein
MSRAQRAQVCCWQLLPPMAHLAPARRFWIDLLTTIPFELVVISACGSSIDEKTARFISLLRLLKLVGAPRSSARHWRGTGAAPEDPAPRLLLWRMVRPVLAFALPRRRASTASMSSSSCWSTT